MKLGRFTKQSKWSSIQFNLTHVRKSIAFWIGANMFLWDYHLKHGNWRNVITDCFTVRKKSWQYHTLNIYSTLLWLIRSKLYYFGIKTKKAALYGLYRLKTNCIRLNNLTLKKIPEQNFHGLLLTSKQSFIFCSSFINFTVAAHAKIK